MTPRVHSKTINTIKQIKVIKSNKIWQFCKTLISCFRQSSTDVGKAQILKQNLALDFKFSGVSMNVTYFGDIRHPHMLRILNKTLSIENILNTWFGSIAQTMVYTDIVNGDITVVWLPTYGFNCNLYLQTKKNKCQYGKILTKRLDCKRLTVINICNISIPLQVCSCIVV